MSTAASVTAPPRDVLYQPTWHRFLSPHYDDVSISCGGTAALLAAHDVAPEVVIVFSEDDVAGSRTPFADEQHARWGLTDATVGLGRRREESAAATILGTVVRLLPFADAIYRGNRYLNDDQLFGQTAADEADLPRRIGEHAGLHQPPDPAVRVYAPLGFGNHVDHQHVFAAAVAASRAGWNVWFYEDLPYGLESSAREARFTELATRGIDIEVAALVDVSSSWRSKLDAIMCYASQLNVIFRHVVSQARREEIDRAMQSYASSLSAQPELIERYWKLSSPQEGREMVVDWGCGMAYAK